jgi:hypothetical protein
MENDVDEAVVIYFKVYPSIRKDLLKETKHSYSGQSAPGLRIELKPSEYKARMLTT